MRATISRRDGAGDGLNHTFCRTIGGIYGVLTRLAGGVDVVEIGGAALDNAETEIKPTGSCAVGRCGRTTACIGVVMRGRIITGPGAGCGC